MMRAKGFTLIEVIVAMAIIAILTAIAIPNYTQYVQRSNRSDARGQLLQAAQWMERWRTERGTYVGAVLPLALQCAPSNATGFGTCRNYNIVVNIPNGAAYDLTATPEPGGPMNGDVCGALTLDGTGVRGQGGGTPDICWNR
jgi:type IV pilus assembly protein PilE